MSVMKYRMGWVNCPTLLGSSSSEEEGDDPCVDESHEVQDGLGKLPYTAWAYLSISDAEMNKLLLEVSFCYLLSCFQY